MQTIKTQIYRKSSLVIRALVCACLFFSAAFITAGELRSPEDMQLVQQHIGCEVIERRDTDDYGSGINTGDGDEAIVIRHQADRLPAYVPFIIPAVVAAVTPARFSPAIRAPPAV